MTTALHVFVIVILLICLRDARRHHRLRDSLDGYRVQQALTEKAKRRTTPDNVSDVLDAIDVVMDNRR